MEFFTEGTMKLDKHSSVPLYYQLKEYISRKIDQGDFARGEQIPSELQFCNDMGLSRPTVRQAVSELVSEGKLQIIKGKGTFVSAVNNTLEIPNFNGSTFSFFSDREVLPETILDYRVSDSIREETARAFGDPALLRDGVIILRKVLKDGDNAYAYIESYIPRCLFPNLIDDIAAGKTMVDITVNKYAYLPTRAACRVFVSPAETAASHALDIARGTPVLAVHAELTSRSGAVCEIVEVSLRSDVCKLRL
jgi:GntR family transcriptional regulator